MDSYMIVCNCIWVLTLFKGVQWSLQLMGIGLIWHVQCGYLVRGHFKEFLFHIVIYKQLDANSFRTSAETYLQDIKRMEPIDGIDRIHKVLHLLSS